MSTSIKLQKELFVSGHAGTTVAEVLAISSVPPLLILPLRWALNRAWPAPVPAILEHAMLIMPQAAVMLACISPATLIAVLAVASVIAVLFVSRPSSTNITSAQATLRRSVVNYRAALMVLTCTAILAVDFPAFPRRFAKAETYGTGLMDAGVGSFVFAGGLVRGLASSKSTSRRLDPRKELVRAGALLALGLTRLAVTAAANYQNHVGEYGVHWNFFLTLATIRVVGMLGGLQQPKVAGFLGAAILGAHEYMLRGLNVIAYVHHEPEQRASLLEANKEGLLSLPGYIALHLLAVALGQMIGTAASSAADDAAVPGRAGPRRAQQAPWGTVLQVAALAACLWLLHGALAAQGWAISRRACNAPYLLWTLAMNVQSLLLFLVAECLLPGPSPSMYSAVSQAMALTFLLANVFTGLVNLGVDTLHTADGRARLIVYCYVIALCAAVQGTGAFQNRRV